VSVEGGRAPRWRGDGHEIFFVAPDGAMMAASINTAPVLRASVPQRLFAADIANEGHPYVVTKDGQRFLFGVRARAGVAPAITVDTNWLPGARR